MYSGRIRHFLKQELSWAGKDQAEGSGGSCAWGRGKEKGVCGFGWAKQELCFVSLEDFAWIGLLELINSSLKRVPEGGDWFVYRISVLLGGRNLSSTLAAVRPMKPRASFCITGNQVTTTLQKQPKGSFQTARYLQSTISTDLKKKIKMKFTRKEYWSISPKPVTLTCVQWTVTDLCADTFCSSPSLSNNRTSKSPTDWLAARDTFNSKTQI